MTETEYFKVYNGEPKAERVKKYPIDSLEVGQSFSFPHENYNRIYSTARYYGRKNGKSFLVKRLDRNTGICTRMS